MYVDGFNLCYGVLRNTACKWLGLERFFKLLRPQDDIQAMTSRRSSETDGMVSGRRTTVY